MGNPVLKRQREMTMEGSLSGQGYGHLQELLIFIFRLKIYQTEGACAPVFIKGAPNSILVWHMARARHREQLWCLQLCPVTGLLSHDSQTELTSPL